MPTTDILHSQFKARAVEIAGTLNLGYMHAAGETVEDADVKRFTVYSMTDGDDDGWVDFFDTAAEVATFIFEKVRDEWGVQAVFDLHAQDYGLPLELGMTVTIAGQTFSASL